MTICFAARIFMTLNTLYSTSVMVLGAHRCPAHEGLLAQHIKLTSLLLKSMMVSANGVELYSGKTTTQSVCACLTCLQFLICLLSEMAFINQTESGNNSHIKRKCSPARCWVCGKSLPDSPQSGLHVNISRESVIREKNRIVYTVSRILSHCWENHYISKNNAFV